MYSNSVRSKKLTHEYIVYSLEVLMRPTTTTRLLIWSMLQTVLYHGSVLLRVAFYLEDVPYHAAECP